MNCSVCLNDISTENICITNCNHEFCKKCLDSWFDKNKLSCPMCRTNIQYFNHNGENNRVVSIFRNMRQRQPNPVQPTSIILTKRTFLVLNCGLTFSMAFNFILFGLWGSCKEIF